MDATIIELLKDKIETVDKKVDKFVEMQAHHNEKVQSKLDTVLEFKWQIVGGSVVLSVVVTLAFQLAAFVWGK